MYSGFMNGWLDFACYALTGQQENVSNAGLFNADKSANFYQREKASSIFRARCQMLFKMKNFADEAANR